MTAKEIHQRLTELRDEKYCTFISGLIPDAYPGHFIGVRTPQLRQLAKEIARDGAEDFLAQLPHSCFEEDQLHAFIISAMKDYDQVLEQLRRFLPFVDNWATCDQLRPAVFRRNRERLIDSIRQWISSGETYTVRFGLGMLMLHYLDGDFLPEYLELAAGVRSDEYYVKMMQAWYFATALAMQYQQTLPYIEEKRLDRWVHNKTIQKARESFRVTDEHKEQLRQLRL